MQHAVLCKTGSGNDKLMGPVGCPAYLSPEMLTADANYSGFAADVWCLGVLLFLLTTKRYPFHVRSARNIIALMFKIRYLQPHLPTISDVPNMSMELRYLIMALLNKSPEQRPSALTLLTSQWFSRPLCTRAQGLAAAASAAANDQVVPL